MTQATSPERVPGGLVVAELAAGDEATWDAFVRSSTTGLPTQLAAWRKIMSAAYGYRCHFLLARQAGQIEGVLPLFRLNSALTGRSLQSLPGGVCAASPAAAQSLIAAADDLARSLKANYLLLRDSRQAWPESGLETVEAHRGIRSNLPGDVEEAWKGLRKDVRYHIRNGKKQGGVEIVLDTCRSDDLYTALLSFSHEMGTPLFGKRFTENVLRAFPHESQIAVAYHQQQPVGGYLNLVLNGRLFGLWGGSLYAVRPLKVTHQVYWALIEDAIQAGYTQIDMGRSAHPSSQYDFKVQWGNETYPIYQLYRVYQGDTPAAVRVSASSQPRGQFGRFRHMWQRLPRPLARVLGPQVRRHIPFG